MKILKEDGKPLTISRMIYRVHYYELAKLISGLDKGVDITGVKNNSKRGTIDFSVQIIHPEGH